MTVTVSYLVFNNKFGRMGITSWWAYRHVLELWSCWKEYNHVRVCFAKEGSCLCLPGPWHFLRVVVTLTLGPAALWSHTIALIPQSRVWYTIKARICKSTYRMLLNERVLGDTVTHPCLDKTWHLLIWPTESRGTSKRKGSPKVTLCMHEQTWLKMAVYQPPIWFCNLIIICVGRMGLLKFWSSSHHS